MKKLYFIQYAGINNSILDRRIQELGNFHQVFSGWVVESMFDSKTIYEKISVDYETISFVVFEISKKNYYGRYTKDLWNLFVKP